MVKIQVMSDMYIVNIFFQLPLNSLNNVLSMSKSFLF